MTRNPRKLIVVGQGAAGLAAALSAAEQAKSCGLVIDITLLEKSREDEAGGNTRWSPSNMRLVATDRLEAGFEAEIVEISGGLADRNYARALAENAVATIGWLRGHGVEFVATTYYLSAGSARIQPVGGGAVIVEKMLQAARRIGVKIFYEQKVNRLVMMSGRLIGVEFQSNDGVTTRLETNSVVLASGGFQGNRQMMRSHFGPLAETLRLISPGTHFDTGDGIRLAAEQGASISGDWNGMHIEPIDPRSNKPAPVVLVYPFGIIVDQNGQRFFDEGAGLAHETWELLARDIHFMRPESIAYAILDRRLFEIEGFERAIRSEVPPHQAQSLEALAAQIKVPAVNLKNTVDRFNASACDNRERFNATRRDGLATLRELNPPKSNWACAIERPPYIAYPLVGAIAYTFGGLATNERAEVMCEQGTIPGLYAAGETTGHFYGTAPNAVALLRALVFGKIAGHEAVGFLERPQTSDRALKIQP